MQFMLGRKLRCLTKTNEMKGELCYNLCDKKAYLRNGIWWR